MFKRTLFSVIVSGLLLGSAGAFAADVQTPLASNETGPVSFFMAPAVGAKSLKTGYEGRGSAFPSSSNETGPVYYAEELPKVKINPDRYVGSAFPSASNETGPSS